MILKNKKVLYSLYILIILLIVSSVYTINEYIEKYNIINYIISDYTGIVENESNKNNDIYKKINNIEKSEEYFIEGYVEKKINNIKKSEELFELSFDNLTDNTNKFVKYYLYNRESVKLIKSGKIDDAKAYTEKALKSIDGKYMKYNYILVWRAVAPYNSVEKGNDYIIKTLEKVMDGYKPYSNNYYEIERKIAPIYYLTNDMDSAMKAYIKIIYKSNKNKDSYDLVRALADLSVIMIDRESYNVAIDILNYGLELIPNIESDRRRDSMKLYYYDNFARCYLGLKELDKIEFYKNKIYESQGRLTDEEYNDFLINAKYYDSILLIRNNEVDKAQKALEEASKLLENDGEVLIAEKKELLDIGYANLAYVKKDYNSAIKLYEIEKERLKQDGLSNYKGLILQELKELYYLVGDSDKFDEVEQELKEWKYDLNDAVSRSYIGNYFSEIRNIEILKESYLIKIEESVLVILIIIGSLLVTKKIIILNKENYIDGLSKVYNRKKFDLDYKKVIERKQPYSIIMFDIDNFKHTNDKYGHDFGDIVICTICKEINKTLDKYSTLYRYGGEEFVVITKGSADFVKIAEEIRTTVNNLKWDKEIIVTISLGASNYKEKENILKKADEKLYVSKRSGKNKVTY